MMFPYAASNFRGNPAAKEESLLDRPRRGAKR